MPNQTNIASRQDSNLKSKFLAIKISSDYASLYKRSGLGEPLFNIVCCPTKSSELSKSNIFFGNLLPLFLENPITCLENPITFSGNPIIFLRNPIILFSGSCLIRAVSHGRVCVSVLAPSSSNVYSSSESDFLTNLSIFFRKSNIFFSKIQQYLCDFL